MCFLTHSLCVFFNSSYPSKRSKQDTDGLDVGVMGSVSLVQNASLSTQPIHSFDWSPDKVRFRVVARSVAEF